tara:strand:- start:702 stop:2030 length:1329 start_codon:yes stop_codon:yes gene_type:complete
MLFITNYIKYILTLLLLYIAIYFFISGYIDLNKLSFNQPIIKINFKNNIINILEDNKKNIKNVIDKSNKLDNQNTLDENINEQFETLIIVKKNDTFSKILDTFVRDTKLKNKVIESLIKKYDLKTLKIGQKIFFYQNNNNTLEKIVIPINFMTDLQIIVNDNQVDISEIDIEILKEIVANKFFIQTSLYEDGIKAKLPLAVLTDAIKLLSFDVDFQRDIQKNNIFEISYEILSNKNRNDLAYGKIQYVKLSLQKNNLEYFFFKTKDGFLNYFNRDGKNAQKSLMKTPIDGARLSSSFGMRKHPISGYNKLHKGLDFAAPKGTPIFAAGNGVVEYVGRNGGYGKYIRIRHNGSYKTAYAHLNSYKKGLYKGLRVNQGDVIGYVGSTGVSTGPHLHYEVIYQGKQINPKKMNLPSRKILDGEELKNFKVEVNRIYSDYLFHLYE